MPSQCFPKKSTPGPDMHADVHKKHTHGPQCSAEGSGTSRRQHPVLAEWLLCHKRTIWLLLGSPQSTCMRGILNAFLADFVALVSLSFFLVLFYFGLCLPPSRSLHLSALSPLPLFAFLLVSSGLQRVSWEPGWVPCRLHTPPPPSHSPPCTSHHYQEHPPSHPPTSISSGQTDTKLLANCPDTRSHSHRLRARTVAS